MATAVALPAHIRAAVKAGRTITIKERGIAFARIVPVKRPSATALRRMCRRLNDLDKGDEWEQLVEWPAD